MPGSNLLLFVYFFQIHPLISSRIFFLPIPARRTMYETTNSKRPPVVKQAHTSTGLRVSLPGERIAQTALAKLEGPSSLRTVEVGADSSLLAAVLIRRPVFLRFPKSRTLRRS